ncbi:MAG: rhodanese-like domain-containing protein [Gammaproteobacteria bacterium]
MRILLNAAKMLGLLLTFAGVNLAHADPLPEGAVWLDVRSASEYQTDHIDGALNIPHTEVAKRIHSAIPDKDTPVLLYCGSGRRAGIALEAMKAMGYTNLQNLGGLKQAQQHLKASALP